MSPSRADRPLVLVVEDEEPQQVAIVSALEARGYRVRAVATGRQAVDAATTTEPHVVLVDLGLPDIDGLDLCRRLRPLLRCPLIVVTADVSEDRLVAALDIGADDYVTKPFSMRVLLARLRVALRHGQVVDTADVLRCGDVTIDLAAHQLTIGGEPVDLPARPFAALALLVRNEGRVVTYARLAEALGGVAEVNGLRVMLSRIRKLLGSGRDRPEILTETAVGYRLVRPE